MAFIRGPGRAWWTMRKLISIGFASACLVAGCGDDVTGDTDPSSSSSASGGSTSTTASTTATTADTSASSTATTTDDTGTTATTTATTDGSSSGGSSGSGSSGGSSSSGSSDGSSSSGGNTTGPDVCCLPDEAPPCIEGSSCCVDGTWACNDEGGNPTCDVGVVCEQPQCCVGDPPACMGGPASCCGNGEWSCPEQGACDVEGEPCPPPPSCCDPDAMPFCLIGTASCCADGMWQCPNGDEPPACDPGEVCGGMCVGDGESCAMGEACCEDLQCCGGVPIEPGQEFCGQVCPISDRNRKHNFAAVDPQTVLERVVAMPITTWSYRFEDDAIRHIGPMAQDFHAAFGVGKTDKLIFQVDADGVALASIQALHAELEQLREDKAALQRELGSLEQRLAKLEAAGR